MKPQSHNAELVLARLKDFQLRTVDYVFRRFYLDADATDRFLVADEVGLGKTLVARGIIARAIDHLSDKVDRIDIVYICSNTSIASQNIGRLNVSGVQEFIRPTRLSLLPMEIAGIRGNKVNYVSLTPGTSFDPKSRDGHVQERALIYHILKDRLNVNKAGLRRLLQCRVRDDIWVGWTRTWAPVSLDKGISKAFVNSITQDKKFLKKIDDFCRRSKRRVLWNDPERLNLVLELRLRLAEQSVDQLEPDLVILDEFQRFRHLLDPENPEARLAKKLFQYADVKTLLLSATPYKMLSLDHESEDDHYPDFLKTLQFLFKNDGVIEDVKQEIQAYRQSLYLMGADNRVSALRTRDALQCRLSRVISRTERIGMTASRDAMLTEVFEKPALEPCDLHEANLADAVAMHVGARDVVEYWKSTPYLISFLRRYELRRKLEEECRNASWELVERLHDNRHRLLKRHDIQTYRELRPANPRMRHLFSRTLDRGLWQLLWLPPTMPYMRPGGAYAVVPPMTKQLVFSSWTAVPDAIAALSSYEAERRMLLSFRRLERDIRHDNLYEKLRPLLRFARTDGRLSGMNVLLLLFPSPSLAALVDPLEIALDYRETGGITADMLVAKAKALLEPILRPLIKKASKKGAEDQRWYWAAPAMLDGARFPATAEWLCDDAAGWTSLSMAHEDGEAAQGESFPRKESDLFTQHLEHFLEAMNREIDPPLGRPPDDLMEVIALMAVAAPGVCSLRMLHRIAPGLDWGRSDMLGGAARVSEGFRTLFNLPETIGLLRGEDPDTAYWRLALRYCLDGNLQSLLDEQGHCLLESLGAVDKSESDRVREVGESIGIALSIRVSQLQVDEISVRPRLGTLEFTGYNTRCRFALRFAELKDEQGAVKRADVVREAFNSPFRPFVLASTSIGQEGLDFHTWCHAVVHWNLPSNPVDLEQREGRVHRYKGHAIRKNIVKVHGLGSLRARWNRKGDPWEFMFEEARKNRSKGASDLVPYWLYEVENGATIERHVPMLAWSKDEQHFQRLKKLLAIYRLVFGQPRQEDLLNYLADHLGEDVGSQDFEDWRITLEPPGDI